MLTRTRDGSLILLLGTLVGGLECSGTACHPPNIIDTSSRPQPHLMNMITLTKVSAEDMGHRIQACRVARFLQTTHWL